MVSSGRRQRATGITRSDGQANPSARDMPLLRYQTDGIGALQKCDAL